jgi:hypothetical protein
MTLQDKKSALLREKADTDYRASDLSAHITEAIQKAKMKGTSCPPSQLTGWKISLAKLKKRSQEIQIEITAINGQLQTATSKQLGNAFIAVAKSVLDQEQYQRIMTMALCQVNITDKPDLRYVGRRE